MTETISKITPMPPPPGGELSYREGSISRGLCEPYVLLGKAAATTAVSLVAVAKILAPHAEDIAPEPVIPNSFVAGVIEYADPSDCPAVPADATMVEIKRTASEPAADSYVEAVSTAKAKGLRFDKGILPVEAVADAPTPEAATKVASDYLQKQYGFGINLTLAPEKMAGISLGAYQDRLNALLRLTAMTPTQLLKAAAISDLEVTGLVSDPPANRSSQAMKAAAITYPKSGKIVFDINYLGDASTWAHEVYGHRIQQTRCNGMAAYDTTLITQNPADFSYTGLETTAKEATPGVTVSGYGGMTVQEDNATLISDYVLGKIPRKIVDSNTAEGNKLAITLSRLESIAPGSAEYFAQAQPYFAALGTGSMSLKTAYSPPN